MPTNLTAVGCPGADPAPAVGVQGEPAPGQAGRPVDVVLPRARRHPRPGRRGARRGQPLPRRPRPCWGSPPACSTRWRATSCSTPRRRPRPPRSTPGCSTTRSAWPPSTPPPAAARTGGGRRLGPARRSAPRRPDHRLPPVDGLDAARARPAGAPVAPELDRVLPAVAARGVIVDCRSAPYAAAWRPGADLAPRWVQVRVPGASHMAKHTRGLVARHLCRSGVTPRSVPALPTWWPAPSTCACTSR